MYRSFFGLEASPFQASPDPAFLYLSASHQRAFESFIQGVQKAEGVMLLTGQAGTGKTTIVRSFLEGWKHSHICPLFGDIDLERLKAVVIFVPDISFKSLLRMVYAELGISLPPLYQAHIAQSGPGSPASRQAISEEQMVSILLEGLHAALQGEQQHGNRVLLIVEDAQDMPVHTLAGLQRLAQWRGAGTGLLQVALVGQSKLDSKLEDERLKVLHTGIDHRAWLSPLSREETADYIRHRMRKAGAKSEAVFTRGACRSIHAYSGGIPKVIHSVCDKALMEGYALGKRSIGLQTVKEVLSRLESRPRQNRSAWILAGAAACLLLFTVCVVSPLQTVWSEHDLGFPQSLSPPVQGPEKQGHNGSAARSQAGGGDPRQDQAGNPERQYPFWLEDIQFPQALFQSKDFRGKSGERVPQKP